MMVDPNVQGRLERAPLSAASFLLNFISIVGNLIVLHIFRTKYENQSNYRIFVLFIAALDSGTVLGHLIKEGNRIIQVYNGGKSHACQITTYIGYSIGFATLLIVLFIAVERYKKICTPFKSQITIEQSRIMCVVVIVAGAVINIPVVLMYGPRKVELENNITATRCSVMNKFDNNLLPVIHFGFLNIASFLAVVFIIVIQVKVRKAILHQSALRQRVFISLNHDTKKLREKNKFSDAVVGENLERKENSGINQGSNYPTCISSQLDTVKKQAEEDKNNRITFTFCIVTILLLISFQVFLWFQTILSVDRYLHPEHRISESRDIFYDYMPDVITINAVLNPFVYYFTDSKFKSEFKRLFRK